ncbi:cytochrome o ubiquinol oxidase subunit III [soil metagenome]|jgi:heme/copper-type cytochrome/quinol oxidase subunit 3|nr:heme-copper oxidase subunit III [Gemmatimonadota bacterium]
MVDHSAAQAHAADPAHLDTSTGLDNRKMAMWALIGSECLLFGGMIASYMVYEGNSVSGPLPAQILDIPLTSLSTFVLLASSLFMVLGLSAVQRGDQPRARNWLLATAFFGLIFLAFQAYEFNHFVHVGLGLGTNLFGSTFFLLTGTHGAHVAVGVIWLTTLALLAHRGKLGVERSIPVEVAGLYWHFVDVVWIVIFTLVYLIHTPLPT